MNQSTLSYSQPSTDPLKLTASAVNYLIKILPKGTAYCIGIVLVVMMTGRLVQFFRESSSGSLASGTPPQMGMASGRESYGTRKSPTLTNYLSGLTVGASAMCQYNQ